MIKPLQTILFLAAMLSFIFTVVYRMVKSGGISTALATLVESRLIVAFFIFIGIVVAYLLYFIYDRVRRGPDRHQIYHFFSEHGVGDEAAYKPGGDKMGHEPSEKAESLPNS